MNNEHLEMHHACTVIVEKLRTSLITKCREKKHNARYSLSVRRAFRKSFLTEGSKIKKLLHENCHVGNVKQYTLYPVGETREILVKGLPTLQ